LGAVVNDLTISQFKCKIICGAANNVLKDAVIHGKALLDRAITYVPDYVANAGGVINVFHELKGYNRNAALKDVERIYERVSSLLILAKDKKMSPGEASDLMSEQRIQAVKNTKAIYLP
jgi:leucine dehydrogenase